MGGGRGVMRITKGVVRDQKSGLSRILRRLRQGTLNGTVVYS